MKYRRALSRGRKERRKDWEKWERVGCCWMEVGDGGRK